VLPSRRILVIGAAAVVVIVAIIGGVMLAGGSDGSDGRDGSGGDDTADGPRTVQPGAPGEEGRELTDEEVADIEGPEHTPVDTAFVQDMILHHAQALEMAALVDERTERSDLPVLAERITVAQEAETEQLETWLTERDEDVPDDDARQNHAGHAGVPGMATPEDLDRLEQAEGPAFDRLFLELMIAHHAGAVTMVEELYADGGGIEPAADRIARDVEADQSIEITRMQELLATLP
jgi:uncharacterized protein (DUF305 family)